MQVPGGGTSSISKHKPPGPSVLVGIQRTEAERSPEPSSTELIHLGGFLCTLKSRNLDLRIDPRY